MVFLSKPLYSWWTVNRDKLTGNVHVEDFLLFDCAIDQFPTLLVQHQNFPLDRGEVVSARGREEGGVTHVVADCMTDCGQDDYKEGSISQYPSARLEHCKATYCRAGC